MPLLSSQRTIFQREDLIKVPNAQNEFENLTEHLFHPQGTSFWILKIFAACPTATE